MVKVIFYVIIYIRILFLKKIDDFLFFNPSTSFNTDKFNSYLENKMGLSKEQVTKINITMGKINDIIKNTLGEDFPICHSYFIADREGIKI